MNKFKVLIIICIILIICKATYGQENERWYLVSMGGSPIGYMYEKNDSVGDQHWTLSEMNLNIGRLGSNVKMETKSTQKEKDGFLVGVDTEVVFSNEKKAEEMRVMKDHLLIEVQGEQRKLPIDTRLIGSKQLKDLVVKQLNHDKQSFYFSTYSADLSMCLTGKIQFSGTEIININGKEYTANVVEESYQEMPYNQKKWLTQSGVLLKSTSPSPFGEMEVISSSKENALSSLQNSVDIPEEQYGKSMPYSNHRLSNPRKLTSVTIKITQTKKEFGFPDFSSDYQSIVSKAEGAIVLQIDKPIFSPTNNKKINLEEYLEPNAFLDNSDELIIKKTKEVIGDEKDEWEKVKLITDWTHKNMIFDAGIMLANSREVIRDLKGTCISYAMLTTTMSKAAGIPARFLMGYVYVDGAWGGHAWTEVYIKGQWIPIDAAVHNSTYIADAARFVMVRSSLKEGMGKVNIAGMQLFGNIEVEILKFRMNDKNYVASEKAYSIENDIYSNPGLLFSMKKIPGFEFSELDNFFPDKTILKQSNRSSEIIIKHQEFGSEDAANENMKKFLAIGQSSAKAVQFKLGKYSGFKISNGDKTVAILKEGTNAFISLKTTGPNHRELLDQALSAIK